MLCPLCILYFFPENCCLALISHSIQPSRLSNSFLFPTWTLLISICLSFIVLHVTFLFIFFLSKNIKLSPWLISLKFCCLTGKYCAQLSLPRLVNLIWARYAGVFWHTHLVRRFIYGVRCLVLLLACTYLWNNEAW